MNLYIYTRKRNIQNETSYERHKKNKIVVVVVCNFVIFSCCCCVTAQFKFSLQLFYIQLQQNSTITKKKAIKATTGFVFLVNL